MPPNQSCSNCQYFLLLTSTDQDGKGLCRHDPPKHNDQRPQTNTDDRRWPVSFAGEWCGQWSRQQ